MNLTNAETVNHFIVKKKTKENDSDDYFLMETSSKINLQQWIRPFIDS